MANPSWKPWHEACKVREELRSGDLAMSQFAADIHDVAMNRGTTLYRDPQKFFALTYPTHNLRRLARDVVYRLAGRSDKAVRQLMLTYGGGKTHAMVTLYHLVHDPEHLPDLPAVHDFIAEIGFTPPRARMAVLSFDRLDPVKGVDVRSPDGEIRAFKYPWSVLAYQLLGEEGLHILGASEDGERETAAFTNVLEELLVRSSQDGMAVLILIDEVLMWARTMAGISHEWRSRLQTFFQCLTQAVTKVPRCAVVASLLATDPRKSDTLGREIVQELSAVFRREQEEPVEPVGKEDVAEILRRRLFMPYLSTSRDAYRPQVLAALQGIGALDEQTQREGHIAEERYLQSYPFHPELTEIFYTKWTNLSGFQRTRGVLRTFAMALREALAWDDAPLIGANVFLSRPGEEALCEAARELAGTASSEEYEGRKQEWTAILQGELAKARAIQSTFHGLRHRELEQAVMATFLHSQPIDQRGATTREVLALVGATSPDRIELEQALAQWAAESWFLDDETLSEAEVAPTGATALPKTWRLGSRPNLIQMHHVACQSVREDVDTRLDQETQALKRLTADASGAGARPHNLPMGPSDVEDDGLFHFAVLGPSAASEADDPSAVAVRFLKETTGPDKPRVYGNAVVLVVPSRSGLEAARAATLDVLGWDKVVEMLQKQHVDATREATLARYRKTTGQRLPGIIREAYCIVVALSAKGELEAFRITVQEDKSLFQTVKDDPRTRIQDTAIEAAALLPDGPYDLWREGETVRRVKDLAGAFAQEPRLPKILKPQAIYDTLAQGCEEGLFVLRLTRPDRSTRTFWRTRPDEVILKDLGLDLILPEAAELDAIAPDLLAPNHLPSLWETPTIRVRDVLAYFGGGTVAQVPRNGFDEPVPVPRASREVVHAALTEAVGQGLLWYLNAPTTLCGEEVPEGVLADDGELRVPPSAILPIEILSHDLPEAWEGEETTALAIYEALSQKAEVPLPWPTVRKAIDGAIRARHVDLASDSAAWPCEYAGARDIRLRLPEEIVVPPMEGGIGSVTTSFRPGVRIAEAELSIGEIQELAGVVSDLLKRAAEANKQLTFQLRIQLAKVASEEQEVVDSINAVLQQISEKLRL